MTRQLLHPLTKRRFGQATELGKQNSPVESTLQKSLLRLECGSRVNSVAGVPNWMTRDTGFGIFCPAAAILVQKPVSRTAASPWKLSWAQIHRDEEHSWDVWVLSFAQVKSSFSSEFPYATTRTVSDFAYSMHSPFPCHTRATTMFNNSPI